jgi:methylmalonyl-CoA/ethylmalonyl-CoA epimerase
MNTIDHLGIAVKSLDEAKKFYRAMGFQIGHEEIVEHEKVRVAMVPAGDSRIELLEATSDDSAVARFIAKRGEGLHHLSLEAPDFDAVVAKLEGGGVRVVDRYDNCSDKTAFISPRSAFGTLIQFWNAMDEAPAHPPVSEHRYDGETVRVRVNHVSIAVRDIDATLAFFTRFFPVEVGVAPKEGYEPSFRFANFFLNGYKIELIGQNPAVPDGFVRTFLEKRGEGFHHVSIDVDRLDPVVAALERGGVRVVGRYRRARDGRQTAFISPRSAHGVLIQFWEQPEMLSAERGLD